MIVLEIIILLGLALLFFADQKLAKSLDEEIATRTKVRSDVDKLNEVIKDVVKRITTLEESSKSKKSK